MHFAFIFFAFLPLIVYYLYLLRRVDKYSTASLIIFKLPRSGSSWLVQLLNDSPNIFVSKEIIQKHNKNLAEINNSLTENFLIRALNQPSDKLSNSVFPSSRFVEDYLLSLKFIYHLNIIGFSINPEHVAAVNWTKIINSVHKPNIFLLMRSNIVKMAFSDVVGKELRKKCGSANIRQNFNSNQCKLSNKINWNISNFVDSINKIQFRVSKFLALTSNIPAPTHIMYYEDIQIGKLSLVNYLYERCFQSADFIHKDSEFSFYSNLLGIDFLLYVLSLFLSLFKTHRWVKRSSENLRDHLLNFDELYDYVNSHSCVCIKDHLLSTHPNTVDLSQQPCSAQIISHQHCIPL